MVERVLGKDEVTSSILVIGSSFRFRGKSPTHSKKRLPCAAEEMVAVREVEEDGEREIRPQ